MLTIQVDVLQEAFSRKLDSVELGLGVIMESLTGVVGAVAARVDQIQDEWYDLKHGLYINEQEMYSFTFVFVVDDHHKKMVETS